MMNNLDKNIEVEKLKEKYKTYKIWAIVFFIFSFVGALAVIMGALSYFSVISVNIEKSQTIGNMIIALCNFLFGLGYVKKCKKIKINLN